VSRYEYGVAGWYVIEDTMKMPIILAIRDLVIEIEKGQKYEECE